MKILFGWVVLASILVGPLNLFAAANKSIEADAYLQQESKVASTAIEKSAVIITGNDSFLGESSPVIWKNIGKSKITAYSSTVGQTDDTPFIMASGNYVYDGAIAANFLPLGTKVRFPELFGDKVFTVEDRMNKRFQDRIDIWIESRSEALSFGMKYTIVEIAE